jgi:hypothetical protein
MGVALLFKNCGSTPAMIVDSYIRPDISDNEGLNTIRTFPKLPAIPDYSKPGFPIISAGRMLVPRQSHHQLVSITKDSIGNEYGNWRAGISVLSIIGFIKYRDVFERDYQTNFCFVYQLRRPGSNLTSEGESLFPIAFVMDGPPLYNETT